METRISTSTTKQIFLPSNELLDLSIIVPTRNESGNVENLLKSLQKAFRMIHSKSYLLMIHPMIPLRLLKIQ